MIFQHAGKQKKYRGRVQAYDEAADSHTVRGMPLCRPDRV